MNVRHPLTSFEEYMLRDDSAEHPMVFFLRADLQGEVDATKLQSAFDEVVRRHPIFWSGAESTGWSGLAWKPDPSRIPKLQVRNSNRIGECPYHGIELETQPGIQACLSAQAGAAELWLQFHHACCDGIAGIGFLNELMATYRHHMSQAVIPMLTATHDFPRYECAYSLLTRWEKANRLGRDVAHICRFFTRRLPKPPRAISDAERSLDRPAYVETRLPLTSSMRARLKRIHPLPASVNDVLLRDIYLTLRDSLHRSAGDSEWMRLAVPINLRERGVPVSGCRNNVSMAFLDRRIGPALGKAELLRSISQGMMHVKRHRIGYTMLRALNWFRSVPGGLAGAMALQRSHATAVVSNLGEVFKPITEQGGSVADDVTMKRLGFLVPIRTGTPFSFGVLTYAGKLTLCLQYDPQFVARHSAERLLAGLATRLCDSLAYDDRRSRLPSTRRVA